MANFPTHITTAGLLGAAYATAGHTVYGMPLQSSILAGGLCAVAGVLPDVDSDNAVILRESLSIVSLLTPLLLLDRFQELGWGNETIVLAVSLGYLIIRFGVGEIIRRLTVHRGMWHSIPAALLAGGVIFYICECSGTSIRYFKSGAVLLGYLWHLLLDEFYSIERKRVGVRLKKSFGTALKLFSSRPSANLISYGLLFAMVAFIFAYPPQTGHAPTAHQHAAQPTTGYGDYPIPTGAPYPAPQPYAHPQQFPENQFRQPVPQLPPSDWQRTSPSPWPPIR